MKGLIGRLLFPPRCAACGKLLDWYQEGCGLCEDCIKAWNEEKRERCAICTKEVKHCACMPELLKKARCEGFRKLVYYYPNTRSRVQNRVIYTIKEKRARTVFAFLASEMKPLVDEIVGDRPKSDFCIVYLPRTREAKSRYDVDQAEQLARALSKQTGISCLFAIGRNGGREQKRLLPNERLKNAQESFFVKREAEIGGRHILLVDDIVTTGAGMAVATKQLMRAGAKSVYALTVVSDVINREIQ